MVAAAGNAIREQVTRLQQLHDTGRCATIIEEMDSLPADEVRQSPALALLVGIACGRMGNNAHAREWVSSALEVSRARGEAAIEARALNVRGAIAFHEGRLDEATGDFSLGLARAEQAQDPHTVGRCSNNLGIIANLRGEHRRAIGSYTMAQAAYAQAGSHAGLAETLHNLALTYRDQRVYWRAMQAEDRAADEAVRAGNPGLLGLIHCGRGDIRVRTGDIELGRREIERALELHRDIGDAVGQAEDLRALAEVLDLAHCPGEAESLIREVIERARDVARPLLAAQAERDLARMLHRRKRNGEAAEAARRARRSFAALGAVFEVARLDGLLRDLD